ncbi:AvrPphF family type III effector [Ralstonia solanacearum]|uniref:AvrPphF family type III effector n=1 Tax=Ralstonia solanacearum TaxID=305 RepID=UPI001E290302|nr:AvrPphF family type III effector [Ralstonia solanacearum]
MPTAGRCNHSGLPGDYHLHSRCHRSSGRCEPRKSRPQVGRLWRPGITEFRRVFPIRDSKAIHPEIKAALLLRNAGGGQVFLDTRAAARSDGTHPLIVTLPEGKTIPVTILPAGQPGASTSKR